MKTASVVEVLVFFETTCYIFHLELKSTDEKGASHSSTKEFLTPLDKFRGGLGYLSVSDLTAQFWCEQQMEYNFLAPEPKPDSEPMQQGKNIHLARGTLLTILKLKLFPTHKGSYEWVARWPNG